jgi:hypothetical protein
MTETVELFKAVEQSKINLGIIFWTTLASLKDR